VSNASPGSRGAGRGDDGQAQVGEEAAVPVRAGGGVIWRRVPTGTEVILVHRPAYDDWSFPKGKAKALESEQDAALREVGEETGLSCRAGWELPSTTYVDGLGRPKTVRYWAMTVVPMAGVPLGRLDGPPPGQDEVDDIRWAPFAEARRRMSYARDVMVLDALEELLSSDVRRQEVHEVLEAKPERHKAG